MRHTAEVAALCALALLGSNLSAVTIAPLYVSVLAFPLSYRMTSTWMPVIVAVSATLTVTWHKFDIVASFAAAVIGGSVTYNSESFTQ